jgi:glycogen debranching enzyme
MNFIEIGNKYYILATSSLADQRPMVLKQGDSFALFDSFGDIHQIGAGKQGIYHGGTRYISRMDLHINGHRPLLLSASPREDNQVLLIDLTNPDLNMEDGNIALHGSLHIERSKFLWQSSYYEKIKLANFGLDPVSFTISLKFEGDFADIFEVRGMLREKRGVTFPAQRQNGMFTFSYQGLDNVIRTTQIHFDPAPRSVEENLAAYYISLLPKQEVDLNIEIGFGTHKEVLVPKSFEEARNELNAYMDRTSNYCAEITTSHEPFNDWIRRSKSDLITMTTQTPQGLYPYAGIPWYSTPFGRDGIITAMECLWVEPQLAKGVLHYLAHTQARDFNDFRDAEPGKIFHETRSGEMAELNEIPFKMYYGTIDATPLFISLAGAYLERTNDMKTISAIWPNIERALHWIDECGDVDGDGFVEYKTKSSKGLTNQGWKDSQDAIFYEDGRLAEDPIALCEVQGYVYDAKIQAARIARVLGFSDTATRLETEAGILKDKFNEKFWSESKQTYVIALDGKKNPCNVISSNAGHCLFSGIATQERAERIAKTLLAEPMFSGWGIRTIASGEARYNPMSYHNGSIWPHDNALIAYGFSRYRLMNEVLSVLTATFDTTNYVEGQRLPELFCGFEREKGKAPTSYPVACSPQAWSVGAIFLLIQACLGMKINAAKNTITFCNPMLPSYLSDITITNLRVADKTVVLQIRKGKEGVEAALLSPHSGVIVEVKNEVAEAVLD